MVDDKKLQEKYMEYQVIEQQLKSIQEHLSSIQDKLLDLASVQKAVNEFQDIKKDSEILSPLSQGIFIKSKLSSYSQMMVNVGGNTVVKKKPDEVVAMLEKQSQDMAQLKSNLESDFAILHNRFLALGKELQQMIGDS